MAKSGQVDFALGSGDGDGPHVFLFVEDNMPGQFSGYETFWDRIRTQRFVPDALGGTLCRAPDLGVAWRLHRSIKDVVEVRSTGDATLRRKRVAR
jgi:hypothetical protein